jgi:fatty-acid peroxygenase
MTAIPTERSFDSTLALLSDPYRFISARCRAHGTDIFSARILLARTICISGREAAELFYQSGQLVRAGAMPMRIQRTLVGRGGVQGLDGAAHRRRKQMFLSLMPPERVHDLGELVVERWLAAARGWAGRQVCLYDQAREILLRAVCVWAGVPLPEDQVGRRTREVAAMFDYAGRVGPSHWWARLARVRSERWAQELVEELRAGRLRAQPSSALQVIATHRSLDGELLPPRIAAVELLNVLRPTVAVAVFLAQLAHALHLHPLCRQRIVDGDDGFAGLVAQEVRRSYPFFPAAVAHVAADCVWQGYRLPRGRRVFFDLYGTNHDPRCWEAPEEFRPERFLDRNGDPFCFVPQGGGDHSVTHRCPGEWIAHEIMRVTALLLARRLSYRVPDQDLTLDFARLPALPRSRFVIDEVVVR